MALPRCRVIPLPADQVSVDEAVFYPIDDANAALNRFRTGEMDIAYSSVPSSRFAWVKPSPDEAETVCRTCAS